MCFGLHRYTWVKRGEPHLSWDKDDASNEWLTQLWVSTCSRCGRFAVKHETPPEESL